LPANNISREDYLKRILLHQRKTSQDMPMGDLALSVGVTGASATGMVKTLVGQGWVQYVPHKGVRLTPSGHEIAAQVLRRHRLIELFLVRTLKIDWAQVHDEAETIEHAISDKLLAHIDEFLGHPQADPHGDPIPNAKGQFPDSDLKPITLCAPGQSATVKRIIDQSPDFLKFIDQLGFKPGSKVNVVRADPTAQVIVVKSQSAPETALALSAAINILVDDHTEAPAASVPPRRPKKA
jgi:DtxR family transcriptional regulator, Mn-dependent transcriptional regulator